MTPSILQIGIEKMKANSTVDYQIKKVILNGRMFLHIVNQIMVQTYDMTDILGSIII